MPSEALPIEAARDLLGIMRAMWWAAPDAYVKRPLAAAGRDLKAAIELAQQHLPGSAEDAEAHALADGAIQHVFQVLHWNAPLAPVLGAAAARVRKR